MNSVPLGYKNNCFMMIDVDVNVDRKKSNKSNRFCDDLSPWDSEKGTISKVFYLLTDNFKLIYKKNSEYCISKGKKKTFVPIEPQPDDKDVVIMNRYYCTLKRQNTYKKRVPCIHPLLTKISQM